MATFGGTHAAPEGGQVDENGAPETPVEQAVKKRRDRNLLYLGLAIGALAIVVTIYEQRKAQAAAGASTVPQLGGNGLVAGDGSTLGTSGTSGADLGAIQSQLQAQTSLLGNLQQEIGILQGGGLPGATGTPIPGPKPKSPGTPGQVGAPLPKAKVPLPRVNSHSFAADIPLVSKAVTAFGKITANHTISGGSVKAGAPVYALVNTGFGPIWEQYFDPKKLPVGTQIGTLSSLGQLGYVTPAAPAHAAAAPKPVASKPVAKKPAPKAPAKKK